MDLDEIERRFKLLELKEREVALKERELALAKKLKKNYPHHLVNVLIVKVPHFIMLWKEVIIVPYINPKVIPKK